MRNIDEIIKFIKTDEEECYFSGEVPFEIIEKAENYLKISFPNSYKRFLQELGNANIGGQEIYGITKDKEFENSGFPNGIWFTANERETISLPEELLIIYYDGDDFYFCLDTSQMKEGECPVVAFDVSGLGEKEKVYDTFIDFVNEECIALLMK